MIESKNSKSTLRATLRKNRASIPEKDKKRISEKLVTQFNQLPLENSKDIAVYLSIPEEISTFPLIKHLLMKGHKVYVPVLHPHLKHTMWFQKITTDTKNPSQ